MFVEGSGLLFLNRRTDDAEQRWYRMVKKVGYIEKTQAGKIVMFDKYAWQKA